MDIDSLQDTADSVSSRDDLVRFIGILTKSILSGEVPMLKSYEVMDGCESFTANIHGWCRNQNIPFDEKPTWKLVAWIVLAGAMND